MFKTINVVLEPGIFLLIAVFDADAAVGNPNGIKILLDNDISIFSINGNANFNNGPWSLPRNTHGCIILEIEV